MALKPVYNSKSNYMRVLVVCGQSYILVKLFNGGQCNTAQSRTIVYLRTVINKPLKINELIKLAF